ncbi:MULTISPECIES: hypothetical protein [unclassified Nostoc]|uniref:hypothetical protein n=1 Tax=unclassified Nostoc TaxID=2593658 RepID=UPI001DEDAF36|nr:hypothetical protein [Nostoc sp. JL23]MBN3876871.1 hypothetical protein [Nostoc sp. JL23]
MVVWETMGVIILNCGNVEASGSASKNQNTSVPAAKSQSHHERLTAVKAAI